jgi:hypothetical protein
MRKALQTLSLAALGALALAAAPAQAQQANFPRTVGSGEDSRVDYGPMGMRTMVFGGGRVVVTMMDGANVTLMHLDSMFMQASQPGLVPLTIGTSENTETVWVPAGMIDAIRRARALGTGR